MPVQPFNRRQFTKSIGMGAGWMASHGAARIDAAVAATDPALAAGASSGGRAHGRTHGALSADGQTLVERERQTPVAGQADVIVCGGGPAGIAAALSAAASGAKTRLIEVHGCLGGVWTAGALSFILDGQNKRGIMVRLLAELRAAGGGRPVGSATVYDPETMKWMLEKRLTDAGVSIRLLTRVVGAITAPGGRLTTVVTESKSGREAWTADTFVDCTGDGDLAAQAGCRFELGHPETGATQPMSLMALMTGPTREGIARFVRGDAEPQQLGNPKQNLLADFRRAGIDPSYGGPTIFRIRDGLYALMANHQYGASAIDADQVTAATLRARREVHMQVQALRKLGGVWEHLRILFTAEQIGTREGRRVLGHYRVTGDDLRRGARFEDAVCRVTFGIDVHATNPQQTKEIEGKPFRSQPYDIPLRALIARDVTGLLIAGRCISGDFIAHSSYRVTGNAVAMGEAAGVVAALSAASNRLPHEIPFREVQTQLVSHRRKT